MFDLDRRFFQAVGKTEVTGVHKKPQQQEQKPVVTFLGLVHKVESLQGVEGVKEVCFLIHWDEREEVRRVCASHVNFFNDSCGLVFVQ